MNTRRTSAHRHFSEACEDAQLCASRKVIGRVTPWSAERGSKEAVVLSLLEKKTENYIAIRIPGKDADSVLNAMQSLRDGLGEKFSQVFKTITVWTTARSSLAFSRARGRLGLCSLLCASLHLVGNVPKTNVTTGCFEPSFRRACPLRLSLLSISRLQLMNRTDGLARSLGYRTPEELFDEFLDSVYAAEGCGSIAQDGSQRLPS